MPGLMLTRRAFGAGALAAIAAPALITRRAYAAQPGGQLRVALFKDLRSLNPIKGIFGNEWRTTVNLYNNLTRMTPTGGVTGDLAEFFAPSDNATVWTFTLRDGVTFNDGSALTSADVVATIEKILDPKTAAPYKAELGPVAGVKAIDRRTVRFELSEPFADLPKALSMAMVRIVSEKGIAEFDKLDTNAYGTGPFVLKEFVANDRAVLERNPRYFRSGRPYLDRIVMRVLPDTTAQIAALQNREIDAIAEVESDAFKRVGGIRGVNAVQVTGGTFNNIVLYADRPPFNDARVRMALRLAMDRQAMAEAITGGVGTPADDHPISAAYEYFDKQTPIRKQDLAEARRLMREAGHPNGFEHRLVVSNSPPTREKTAVILQAMAEQIGIRFQLELMDNARYGSTIWNKGVSSYVGNYGTRPMEDAILTKLYSAKYGIDEGRWASAHPESDKMLEEARRVTDPARRRAIYAKYQQMARDQGPFIIPNFFNSLFASWSYVNAFPTRAITTDLHLEDTWLSADAPGRKT